MVIVMATGMALLVIVLRVVSFWLVMMVGVMIVHKWGPELGG